MAQTDLNPSPGQRIIRDQQVVSDDWNMLERELAAGEQLPPGKWIVPLDTWLARHDDFSARGDVAPRLASDQPPEELPECACGEINRLALIAVDFPLMTDGRGFSAARLLRQRHGYRNELRAVGAITRDQLHYLRRCGFNSFALRDRGSLHEALELMHVFHAGYQPAGDLPSPLPGRLARIAKRA